MTKYSVLVAVDSAPVVETSSGFALRSAVIPLLAGSLIGLSCIATAAAQDFAQVISRTAELQQVLVPSTYCEQRTVPAPPSERSNTGAVVGAIAGGLLGSTVGKGDGRVAAAAIGAATGAIIGDRVDNPPSHGTHPGSASPIMTNPAPPITSEHGMAPGGFAPAGATVLCQGSQAIETRIIGFQVVYEYAGKQYSAKLNRDPGDRLPLVITPDPGYLLPAPITSYAPVERRRRRY